MVQCTMNDSCYAQYHTGTGSLLYGPCFVFFYAACFRTKGGSVRRIFLCIVLYACVRVPKIIIFGTFSYPDAGILKINVLAIT